MQRWRSYLFPAAWIVCVLPLLRVAVQLSGGVDKPLVKLLHRTGYWAIIWLCVTLSCTPVRQVCGWTWPLLLRRMLGLCAFTYAVLHAALYVAVTGLGPWQKYAEDLMERWFIVPGIVAFALLVPLALTSGRKMVRYLGFRRWKLLHSSHYIAASLACLHYAAAAKPTAVKPQLFAGLLLVFFLWRWGDVRQRSLRTRRSH